MSYYGYNNYYPQGGPPPSGGYGYGQPPGGPSGYPGNYPPAYPPPPGGGGPAPYPSNMYPYQPSPYSPQSTISSHLKPSGPYGVPPPGPPRPQYPAQPMPYQTPHSASSVPAPASAAATSQPSSAPARLPADRIAQLNLSQIQYELEKLCTATRFQFATQRGLSEVASFLKQGKFSAEVVSPDRPQQPPMMQLKGLFPYEHRGVVYKVALRVNIEPQFPNVAPHVFIVAEDNIKINPSCSYVGPDGRVYARFFDQWSPQYGLSYTFQELAQMFNASTPVYSAAPGASPMTTSSAATPNPTAQSQHFQPPSASQQQPPQHNKQQDYQQKQHQNLLDAITTAAEQELGEKGDELCAQIESLHEQHVKLEHDVFILESTTIEEQNALLQLQQLENALAADIETIDTLLATAKINEMEQKNKPFDFTEYVQMDALSKQLLTESATDAALDDVLMELDQILQDSRCPIDIYLKFVRNTARQQYLARTLTTQIANKMDQ